MLILRSETPTAASRFRTSSAAAGYRPFTGPSSRRMNCTRPDFMNSRVQAIAGVIIACVILLLATPVSAQYFGRNKSNTRSSIFRS